MSLSTDNRQVWSDKGTDTWVVEVLRWGYRIPFRAVPTLSKDPIPYPSYSPSSIRGKALDAEVLSLVEKGAVELASLPSPGFYSQLFVVMKASGSWRPVKDLSLLNMKVIKTSFKMETLQSVLLSVQRGDWMVSLDLKDAFLQVPIHPDSRKYLRFVAFGRVYQFKALCFGLSTAPQVFTRVMALVLTFQHRAGIHIRRYLDDWLIQAASRSQVLPALDAVLQLCHFLGIVFNWGKSRPVPVQQMIYLGVLLDLVSFRASPAQKRVEKLLSIGNEFLSCKEQPVSSWLELLGVLSSLIPLVPGGRLKMRSLQLLLRRSWDHRDQSFLMRWVLECQRDLEWWLVRSCLEEGVSLSQVSPNLDFWLDASDVGWGAHLGDNVFSSRWSPPDADLSINARELLAVERGLHHFAPQVVDSTVAVFVNNSTAVAYLHKRVNSFSSVKLHCAKDPPVGRVYSFSSRSPVHPGEEQCLSGLSVQAQSDSGLQMDAEAGSLLGSTEALAGDDQPFHHLVESPMFSIFFALPQSECLGYGRSSSELGRLSGVCLSTLVPDTPGSSSGVLMTLIALLWPQRPWYPELLELVVDCPVQLPLPHDLLRQPHFHRLHLGISRLSLHAWRLSSDLPD